MGTWGAGIEQDDLILDIVSDFNDILKRNQDIDDATKTIFNQYIDCLEDEEETPLIWIAVAKCQWDYGKLEKYVLDKVISDFSNRNGFSRWEEDDNGILVKKRIDVINDFIEKISNHNPKPKKFPKLIIRKPLFKEGDCLSIQLDDNYYGAAIVLKYKHADVEYGMNLILALNYYSKNRPSKYDFEMSEPLKQSETSILNSVKDGIDISNRYDDYQYVISWYTRLGFRGLKDKIIVIDNIDVKNYSMFNSNSYDGWQFIANRIKHRMNNL